MTPNTGASPGLALLLLAILVTQFHASGRAAEETPVIFEAHLPEGKAPESAASGRQLLSRSILLRVPPAVCAEAGGQAFLAVHLQGTQVGETVSLRFSLPRHVQILAADAAAGQQGAWRGIIHLDAKAAPGTSMIKVYAWSGNTRAETSFELVVTRPTLSSGQAQPLQDESAASFKVTQEQEVYPVLPAELPSKPDENPVSASRPDRWLLMKELQGTSIGMGLDGARITISGWTEASFTASTVADNQLPMGFNYLANQFLLQQNWLRVERTIVPTGTTEPTFGFRNDWILPGSDYRFTISRGLFSRQLTSNDGEPNTYGIDPVQFYGEAFIPTFANGIDIKLGRMFCQYGAEGIDAISNLLASHSYTFIYDPFTHTGLISTTQLTPAWSIQLGIVMGPDVFIHQAASPYSMFSAKWAPPGGRDSVLFSGLLGSGRFDDRHDFNNPNIVDLVYIHTFNSRLTYTLDSLFGYETNVPEIGTATWFSAANYLTWKLTPRLSGTTRLEFFDDVDGNRTGFKGLYTSVTAGLNFQPRKDVIFRPELRYDYNGESRPFEGNHGVFTAATDVVVRW